MARNAHLDTFMEGFPHEGLTFDDVSIVTRYADFLPDDAEISSRLTSRIGASMPLMSAAMDTVTEAPMAIGMAKHGGIGVIHKNLTPKDQAKHVATVKHHLNGLILDPIVFHTHDTLETVQQERERRGFGFSGFPILDEQENVVGILTARDIRFSRDPKAPVCDVMSSNVITAPHQTTLREAYDRMITDHVGKLPIVSKGRLLGLYSFTDVKTLVEDEQPLYNRDEHYRLRVAAAVSGGDHERVEVLVDEHVDCIVVDSAHGHTSGIMDMVKWIATHYPDIDIIAGNIGTAEAAIALRDSGAHAVKVGIGPGSICTTRVVCGVGVPQITAVYDCARALEGSIPVIADGGVRHSGDVPKALLAGAEMVMLGSVLAGTEESPGEKILHQGRQYVVYRGMGSLGAMSEGDGSRARYSQERTPEDELVPQGIEGIVPFAGALNKVLIQYCGGLRASLGYGGCRDLTDLRENGQFVRVTLAAVNEAHPHNVKIMREAPNYRSS
jgi:IMP dehydrogenase